MIKWVERVERVVVLGLMGLMLLIVVAGAIELVVVAIEAMLQTPGVLLLDINDLLNIFGFFLLVLIGLELFRSSRKTTPHHRSHP